MQNTPSSAASVGAALLLTMTASLGGVAWLAMSPNRKKNISEENEVSPTPSINRSGSVPSIASSGDEYDNIDDIGIAPDLSVIPCIRDRRSIFPSGFKKSPPPLDEAIVKSLLEAALYAPFHGRCYANQQHPAKFVVLGKQGMHDMQLLTLEYYDENWEQHWSSEEEYLKFRERTHDEITGRWGGVSYMIAIVMRRQAGPKRFPEWEETSAVACAVQNMHLQSTKFKELACYWSSWHGAARDSAEMKRFLDMEDEDKCMGFFIVGQAKNPDFKAKRVRDPSLMAVEWRK